MPIRTVSFAEAFQQYQRNAHADAGRLARQVLAGNPHHPDTAHLLGLCLLHTGRPGQAEGWLCRTAILIPRHGLADVHTNLAAVQLILGRTDRAIQSASRALALDPVKVYAFCTLSTALRDATRLSEAGRAAKAAITLAPASPEAHLSLGNFRQATGELDGAIVSYDRALAVDRYHLLANSNRLFSLNFMPGMDDRQSFAENRAWGRLIEARLPPKVVPPRPREGRLRIGYHSLDFYHRSAIDYFFPPLLRRHDRDRFEMHLFVDGHRWDERTGELARLCDRSYDLRPMAALDKAELMHAAKCDILVSMTGYLANQRLLFAPRLAPIQVAHINHISTTGLTAFDYRLTDPWLDPLGLTDAYNVEHLVRLQGGYAPVEPPERAPPITPLPALSTGRVTFGSFNNLAKITFETLRLWAGALVAVPGSRLLIKARALDDADVRRRYVGLAERAGIAADRLDFVGAVASDEENLATIGRADIALDPVPFSGSRSTVDALWMGVPVINLKSLGFVGRLGSSMLIRAGQADCVAETPELFVATARRLAGNLELLSEIRMSLRDRLWRSLLLDADRHVVEVEEAYLTMTKRFENAGG